MAQCGDFLSLQCQTQSYSHLLQRLCQFLCWVGVLQGSVDMIARTAVVWLFTDFLELFMSWPLLCDLCRWNYMLIHLHGLLALKCVGREALISPWINSLWLKQRRKGYLGLYLCLNSSLLYVNTSTSMEVTWRKVFCFLLNSYTFERNQPGNKNVAQQWGVSGSCLFTQLNVSFRSSHISTYLGPMAGLGAGKNNVGMQWEDAGSAVWQRFKRSNISHLI